MAHWKYNTTDLAYYVSEYIETELERGNDIDSTTIENAFEAFEGGAYNGEGVHCTIELITTSNPIKKAIDFLREYAMDMEGEDAGSEATQIMLELEQHLLTE